MSYLPPTSTDPISVLDVAPSAFVALQAIGVCDGEGKESGLTHPSLQSPADSVAGPRCSTRLLRKQGRSAYELYRRLPVSNGGPVSIPTKRVGGVPTAYAEITF